MADEFTCHCCKETFLKAAPIDVDKCQALDDAAGIDPGGEGEWISVCDNCVQTYLDSEPHLRAAMDSYDKQRRKPN